MIERAEFQNLAELLDELGKKPLFLELIGSEGTGKTTTIEEVRDYLIREGYVVMPVSPSGGNALRDSFEDGALEELVMSGFEVNNIMLINGKDNLLMVSKEVSEGGDSDIIASMLGAVENFVKDTFGSDDENLPEEVSNIVSFGDNTIVMYSVKDFGTLAVLLHGKIPDIITLRMKNVMDRIRSEYYDLIADWNGKIDERLNDIANLFSPIEELSEKKEFSGLIEEEYYFANRFFKKFQEKLNDGAKIAILVDDYDSIDNASQKIIAALPSIIKSSDLAVVVATSSPMNLRGYTQLNLNNFSYEDVKKLINSKFSLKKPKEGVIKYIYEQTKGNPLLVNENLNILLDSNFDFWGDNLPSLLTDFKQLAEYKLSKIDSEEKEFLAYLSLFGNVGIKHNFIDNKQILDSLRDKGYLVVSKSVSFRYPEMGDILRQEVSNEHLLVAAEKLENDGKYKNAISMRIEYLKKTKDFSQSKKIMSGLSKWVSGMEKGQLPLENPFPLIEELVDVPGFKDSKEFLEIIDKGLFALSNSGSLDEQEKILSEVMDFARNVGSDDIFARASYKYIRIKYKKRKFKESLELIDKISKQWREMEVSKEMYTRLENTKLAIKKELGKADKDAGILKEVVNEVNKSIVEKEKDNPSNEEMDIILELYRIGLSAYSNISMIKNANPAADGILDNTYESEKETFFKKYGKLLEKVDDNTTRVSMWRLLSIHYISVNDIEKAYEVIKEVKHFLTPNNISEAFMSSVILSYLAWVNGHPEEAIEVYKRWYPTMLAFNPLEADYLKGNYLIAKEMTLKEEEREFLKNAREGAVNSFKEDFRRVVGMYPEEYALLESCLKEE